MDKPRIALGAELYPLQIGRHDFVESMLIIADHNEFTDSAGRSRIIS